MMLLVLSRPGCPATAPTAQFRFFERHDEFGVSASGPAGVDARIEIRRRLHVLVAEELSNEFVAAWVLIENEFGRQMPELVRGQLHPEMPQNGLLDRCRDRPLGSWCAGPGNEHGMKARAGYRGDDLVAIDEKAVGKRGRDLEFERTGVLCLV